MWNIELEESRDFALSLSDSFVVSEQQLDNGMSIAVYTFADATVNDRGLELDGAAHVLREAEKTLELFERLFGRYPYDRLVIVQGDFPDGMEFTGIVFVGSAWFYGFDGTTRNYLTLISVHEIAHQWWYARVGNDAALNPWLDEALATYSEYLFIEAMYPEDRNWWWTYRVAGYFPQGQVDRTVYEFNTPREYINAIYLRGAQMLQNLREDIGDEAFFQTAASILFGGILADRRAALVLATTTGRATTFDGSDTERISGRSITTRGLAATGRRGGSGSGRDFTMKLDAQITFLYADNLDLSARFYEDALGLKLALDQGSCRIYQVIAGAAYVGVCQAVGACHLREPASF